MDYWQLEYPCSGTSRRNRAPALAGGSERERRARPSAQDAFPRGMFQLKVNPFKTSSQAFSLIELLFALVIVSSILAISIPRIRQGMELHLQTTARKISSTIRFAYNESALKNLYYRISFTFYPNEEHSYRVEYAQEPFFMRSAEEREEFQRELESMSEKDREEALKKETQFTPIQEHLLKEIKLPVGVYIKDFYVDHLGKKITSGNANLYFFPNGFTERAVINLEDKDGNTYSIETFPLTGKTKVRPEYWNYEDSETER